MPEINFEKLSQTLLYAVEGGLITSQDAVDVLKTVWNLYIDRDYAGLANLGFLS